MKAAWAGLGGTTEGGPQLVKIDLALNKYLREQCTKFCSLRLQHVARCQCDVVTLDLPLSHSFQHHRDDDLRAWIEVSKLQSLYIGAQSTC